MPERKSLCCFYGCPVIIPNIDHKEGTDACSHVLDKRTNQSFPTRVIVKLIQLILKYNVMSFSGPFFHQIKGMAMATLMAVSCANIFMSEFEQRLLHDYEQRYKRKPVLWLRFIDDIFLVWIGDEATLKSFLKYCNEYSKSRDLSSNIEFLWSYSLSTVSFLDVKVKIEKGGSLTTSLFFKPSATFQYLSAKSNHSPHTIKALPKSQLICICRICSSTTDYWKHATEFIKFFTKRGYKPANPSKLATEVSRMDRNDLSCYNTRNNSKHISFVITWHQHLQGIPKVINSAYKAVMKKYPGFQNTFKEPPVVAYRRPKILM